MNQTGKSQSESCNREVASTAAAGTILRGGGCGTLVARRSFLRPRLEEVRGREGGGRGRKKTRGGREGAGREGGRGRRQEGGKEGEFEPKKSLRQQIHSRLRVLGTLNCTIWSPKWIFLWFSIANKNHFWNHTAQLKHPYRTAQLTINLALLPIKDMKFPKYSRIVEIISARIPNLKLPS